MLGRIAPGVASIWARRLFLSPHRAPAPLRETWWATDAVETTLSLADGRRLVAWRWGCGGPRVLLVHGWGGRGLQLGALAAPLVAAGYEVWTYDAPGHGRMPAQRWSLPEHRDVVALAITALGGVEAVIAHSMGAAALTAALDREPGLEAERLVFMAPPADLFAVLERFSSLTGLPMAVVDRMRLWLEARFAIRFDRMSPLAIAPSMERPLLVVHDRDDREAPAAEGAALARAWPGAVLRTTVGLGHNRLLAEPMVVQRVVDFVGLRRMAADRGLAA
ncbi:MAG: alpha/beta fold hydrolase [Acidobacteriota bacterium]